jgi:hypothetical protein
LRFLNSCISLVVVTYWEPASIRFQTSYLKNFGGWFEFWKIVVYGEAFGWALLFYSLIVGSGCLGSLMVFIDFFSLFKRLVLLSDLYTASPLGVRE